MSGVQCGASKVIRQPINYGNAYYEDVTHYPSSPEFKVCIIPEIPGSTYQFNWDLTPEWSSIPYTTENCYIKDKISPSEAPKLFKVRVTNSTCSGSHQEFTKNYIVNTSGTAVRPSLNSQMTVIPNPTQNNWTVTLPNKWVDGTSIGYTIFSIDGKVLFNNTISFTTSLLIDGSSFSQGVYILKLYNGIYSETVKLIKE